MKSLKELIQYSLPEAIKIRHAIHAHPELSNDEMNTSALVVHTLKNYGYEVSTGIGGTGVVAVLDSGKAGKTVALRADMDALPLQEKNDLPFQSTQPGKMHACGHDGHTASLLLAAGVLMQFKNQLTGKIKFIFQPAEENGTGALAMIKNGVLENPVVDAIFGLHNTPYSDAGVVKVKSGCILAGQDAFKITVKGKGGHAAHPTKIIDPIFIGAQIVQAIQSIVSRSSLPTDAVVISVSQFHAGTVFNVMPDEAQLNGTIRTTTIDSQKNVLEKMKHIVQGVAETFGATAEIEFYHHFPPTINPVNEAEFVLKTAKKVVGEQNASVLPQASMASEDFSHYLQKIPGCFFFLGNGNHGAIHSAQYQFNDEIIPVAAEMLSQVAIDYLNNK